MVRRRQLLLGGVLLLLELVGLYVWRNYPRPGVTQENFSRLSLGMTLAKAEAILGPRAKSTCAGKPEWFDPAAWVDLRSPYWKGDACVITLYLDPAGPEGRVLEGMFRDSRGVWYLSQEPTFWDRLRRLFHL
jgi:hypothetical protein